MIRIKVDLIIVVVIRENLADKFPSVFAHSVIGVIVVVNHTCLCARVWYIVFEHI